MPAKSEKQRRLMYAVVGSRAVQRRTGISAVDAQRVLGKHGGKARKKA